MIPRSRAFIAFLVGLLAVNLLISVLTSGPASRPRVPYQPFFVNQVTANNVEDISSQGDSIEGTLKNQATYDPPGDAKPVTVDKDFKTEVPSFIDHTRSSVARPAQRRHRREPAGFRPLLIGTLLDFLPTIPLIISSSGSFAARWVGR